MRRKLCCIDQEINYNNLGVHIYTHKWILVLVGHDTNFSKDKMKNI
jgi:hypothetical protein